MAFFIFDTSYTRPAYNRLSLSLLLLDQFLVSSFSLSFLKKRTRTKESSGSETYPASPAQTCFARDYTEFRMWRGPVFTWPRNPGLWCVMFDACLRHPSGSPVGTIVEGERRRRKINGPHGIRIRALRDDQVPTSSSASPPGDSGFLLGRSTRRISLFVSLYLLLSRTLFRDVVS